ncbi:MAG: SEC-C domain-containing protein [Myxococcales bacterium]|nr:SEC-C domain-containing protein [Myxococcales bacterium]
MPGPRPGRNEPCWCGSTRKYKKCHLDDDQLAARAGAAMRT